MTNSKPNGSNTQKLLFLLLVVSCITLPVTVTFVRQSYQNHLTTQTEYKVLKREQVEQNAVTKQLATHQRYVERTRQFERNAKQAGLSQEKWQRHVIKIDDAPMDAQTFDKLLQDTVSTPAVRILPKFFSARTASSASPLGAFVDISVQDSPSAMVISLHTEILVRKP